MKMNKLEALYNVSPNLYFQHLEQTLEALATRLERAEEAIATTQGNILPLLRSSQPVSAQPVDSWLFDARMPNYYFDNIYEPEIGELYFKRWVGPQAITTWRLDLDRRFQYVVEVDVVDFQTPEYRAQLVLRVDGDPHPWLQTAEKHFKTVVSPRKLADEPVLFELGIQLSEEQEQSQAAGGKAFFSFSRIEIRRWLAEAAALVIPDATATEETDAAEEVAEVESAKPESKKTTPAKAAARRAKTP